MSAECKDLYESFKDAFNKIADEYNPKEFNVNKKIKKDFLSLFDNNNYIDKIKKLMNCNPKNGIVDQRSKIGKAINSQIIEWINSNLTEYFEKFYSYKIALTMDFIEGAVKEFLETNNGKFISNTELLKRAKKLIESSDEARKYYADKFKCIYVDEFQDTSETQTDIILKLAENEQGKLRDGMLFIVGDPKQQLYRFTGADENVYNETKEYMIKAENVRVFELDNNFRANEKIIDWVNNKFSEKFSKYRNMTAVKQEDRHENNSVSDIYISGIYKYNDNTVTNAEDDLKNICSMIKTLVNNNNYKIMDGKKGNRKARKIKYSDFLIITEKSTNINLYLTALNNCGIPVNITSKVDWTDNEVINRFIRIYDYLSNNSDKMAAEGAIQAVERENMSENDIINACEKLEKLKNETKYMNGYALAEYIIHQLDILLPWDTNISKNKIISAQSKLEQILEAAAVKAKGSRRAISEEFNEYAKSEIKNQLSLKENSDEVRLMHLHMAKGLEGKIVVIANRVSSEIKENDYREKNEYYTTLVQKYDKDIKKRADNATLMDKIKVQYVAATRAEEALIFMNPIKKGENHWFEEYDINSCESLVDIIGNNTYDNVEVKEAKEYNSEPYVFMNDEQKKELFIECRPSDFEKSVKVEKADNENTEDISDKVNEEETKIKKTNIFGNITHRSFELMVNEWKKDFSRDGKEMEAFASEFACQSLMDNMEDLEKIKYFDINDVISQYKKDTEENLINFVNDKDIINLLKNAQNVYAELSFSYFTNKEKDKEIAKMIEEKSSVDIDGIDIWVNGIADLVVKDKNGKVHIIDYKSNDNKLNLSAEKFKTSLEERYGNQLMFYKYAISRVLNVPIENIDTEIYHLYRNI